MYCMGFTLREMGILFHTLQPLLGLPEFLQLGEVLVEDEHFGEAEGCRHRGRRRRHRRAVALLYLLRGTVAILTDPRSPHHWRGQRGDTSICLKPRTTRAA